MTVLPAKITIALITILSIGPTYAAKTALRLSTNPTSNACSAILHARPAKLRVQIA